jgi:hypothetical protein
MHGEYKRMEEGRGHGLVHIIITVSPGRTKKKISFSPSLSHTKEQIIKF